MKDVAFPFSNKRVPLKRMYSLYMYVGIFLKGSICVGKNWLKGANSYLSFPQRIKFFPS